jgi:hypothetical protein
MPEENILPGQPPSKAKAAGTRIPFCSIICHFTNIKPYSHVCLFKIDHRRNSTPKVCPNASSKKLPSPDRNNATAADPPQ